MKVSDLMQAMSEVDRDECTNQEHFSTVGCKTLGKPAESVVQRAGAEGAGNTLARPDHNAVRSARL